MADDILAQPDDTDQIEALRARLARLTELLELLDDHERDLQVILAIEAAPRETRH
jgi:hypothetical protein